MSSVLSEIINQYGILLFGQFQWDVSVLSQPWMYYWALVPAIGFMVFWCFKWLVLLSPIWFIFYVVFKSLVILANIIIGISNGTSIHYK